jgi:hypothetical protein
MAGLAAATLAVSPALAQDAYMSPMDFSAQTQALTSSTIGNISVGETARRGGGRGLAAAPRGGNLGFTPGVRVSNAPIPFASTPASRRQALDAYLARAGRKNPKATAILAPELRQRNVHAEMSSGLRQWGLRIDDVADVMAAFLVQGYDTARGNEASPAQVKGVRRQVAAQLLANPAMRNPATRTKLAEELKITTFIIAAGEASAKRDGDLAQYRRGVADMYRRITGENIVGWRLTHAGFAQ